MNPIIKYHVGILRGPSNLIIKTFPIKTNFIGERGFWKGSGQSEDANRCTKRCALKIQGTLWGQFLDTITTRGDLDEIGLLGTKSAKKAQVVNSDKWIMRTFWATNPSWFHGPFIERTFAQISKPRERVRLLELHVSSWTANQCNWRQSHKFDKYWPENPDPSTTVKTRFRLIYSILQRFIKVYAFFASS